MQRMPTPTTCYFVRHAQSAPSRQQAHLEWPLSILGQEQAQQLVAVLSPLKPSTVYSSPYRRCLETLAPFATSSGLVLQQAPELQEKVTSLGFRKDFSALYRQSWTYRNFALAGTESSRVCQQRMLTFTKNLATVHPGETLVLGSHGHALALLLNACDERFGYQEALAIHNPDIFKIIVTKDALAWDQTFTFTDLLLPQMQDFRSRSLRP